MTGENIVITDRTSGERLIPVVTYIPGLFRPKAVSAWLSYLSVCQNDCRSVVRLPDILSSEIETRCLRLLDSVIESYLRVESLPLTVQAEVGATAHAIIAGISREHGALLNDRLAKICGDHGYRVYWEKFESGSFLEEPSKHREGALSAAQLKKNSDFAIVVIALTVLYGCGDEYYERVAALEENVSAKYGSGFPLDRLGLCLWPLDFSFVEDDDDDSESRNEHCALLKAARSINPDVKVQVCADSLLWSRDVIAWVCDEGEAFVESAADGIPGRFGRGLLNEGGNIITGTAVDKFILVAQGALTDVMSEVVFNYEMDNRNIRTYPLPDGFLWARDPETQKVRLLDSIHIDTVINFIPSQYTLDGRPKLIVDPYYLALIAADPDFLRFLTQQSISQADIVVVDERELYLNLPNFSVLPDRNGEKKFLFNKDLGYTLPRLNLKEGLLVQPDIEIVAMASFFGSLRCATNMLPESYVTDTSSVGIAVAENLPSETRRLLCELLRSGNRGVHALSTLLVSRLSIQLGQEGTPWEYDEFSRTAYLYCTPHQAADPQACCRIVGDRLAALAGMVSRRLGIPIEPCLIRG